MTTRFEITGGGEPSPEELAALVIALTPVAVDGDGPAAPPGWLRASLHEGVGARPAVAPGDVDAF